MIGGLIVGFFLVELGLRLAQISYPNFYIYDEHRGGALRPRAEGWWRKEGEAYIRINSDGLRDHEHAKQRPANGFRVAVLGDSYAEALQLPIEYAFWSVLGRELEKCKQLSDRQIEVINFGVAGYGTAQELMTLRHRVWVYQPDMVLLAFLPGNDIRNNSRALEGDPMRPYFVLKQGDLVLDDSYLQSAAYRLRQSWLAKLGYGAIKYSRVLQVTNEARHVVKTIWKDRRQQIAKKRVTGTQQEIGLDNTTYKKPVSDVWKEAWEVTERLIVQMRDEVLEKGAKFLVVTLTNGIQVHPDAGKHRSFRKRLNVPNLFYADLRIKALGDQENISVLNLAQPFQAYAEKNQVYLHGFENATLGGGHWNTNGHRLAGELIAGEICRDISL